MVVSDFQENINIVNYILPFPRIKYTYNYNNNNNKSLITRIISILK